MKILLKIYGEALVLVNATRTKWIENLKTSKPAFLMFSHHWSTRETPFKWRFAGDLNGVSLEGKLWTTFNGIWLLSHQL